MNKMINLITEEKGKGKRFQESWKTTENLQKTNKRNKFFKSFPDLLDEIKSLLQ